MSSNAIGTVFRIAAIFAALLSLWLAGVGAVYVAVCLLAGYPPTFGGFGALFAAVTLLRMFYPRNVFA